jgi:hypothetical protein
MISLKHEHAQSRLTLEALDSDGFLIIPRDDEGYDIWARQQSLPVPNVIREVS